MPSGSRDQWNLIRVESCAASFLGRLLVFPRWSGLLCEHRGIADHHLRSQEACDAYINRCVSSGFDLLKFLILLPPRFPPASMTETKAERQNTFANPYSSARSLPFDTNEYVTSPILSFFFSFLFFSFFRVRVRIHSFRVLAYCLSPVKQPRESVIRWTEATLRSHPP